MILSQCYNRRDKVFCHECRYCCTLSICTYQDGTFYKFTHNRTDKFIDKEVNKELNAAIGFSTDALMYKENDYRCLKPKKNVPSKDWPHYEMEAYRKAKTESDLRKVKEIPFDINFFNWEDPEVWKAFTSSRQNSIKVWKKTYGFDFVGIMPGIGHETNSLSCQEHCLKEEFGSYAKKCRKDGGFFKCCVLKLTISIFETIRYELKKMHLIEHGPNKSDIQCDVTMEEGLCHFCLVTHVCAKKVEILSPIFHTH